MTTPTLGVTGSTGRLGGRVAARLAAAGVSQRLVVRDLARAPTLDGAPVASAEYGDPDAGVRALTGIRTLFMVSGSETPDRVDRHRTFVDAAVSAGVEHVVYLSFYGAAPDATFTLARDHWATEEHIRASGLHWTFLRDNLYLDFFPAMVGDDGIIRGPAANGRVAAVAQDDIAEVATAVLRDPAAHEGQTYDLTGPEALTMSDVADQLSWATERVVGYIPETLDDAYRSRADYGAPDWQVDAWVSTYTAIAAGELAKPTDIVERIAGHAPISLADLLLKRAGDLRLGSPL
ncbi:MAG TPA: SDR family oxidoreductase [Jiangellaceae bacterium]|nr:SDR family oxidoreductase [Jiangellaceae bacterium]